MQHYNTVHVADLFLTEGSGCEGGVTDILDKGTSVDMSVLQPVRNEELLLPCLLDSLLQQTQCGSDFVAVLNGCTDSSEDILRSYDCLFQKVPRELCSLESTRTISHRVPRDWTHNCSSCPNTSRMCPWWARRLWSFSAESSALTVAGNIPCDQAVLECMMLCRCVLLHPTVMFHRDSILAVGGHGGAGSAGGLGGERSTASRTTLWAGVLMRWANITYRLVLLRITNICVCVHVIRYPFSICNLPHVSTALLLGRGSTSETQRDTALVDGLAVRCSLRITS